MPTPRLDPGFERAMEEGQVDLYVVETHGTDPARISLRASEFEHAMTAWEQRLPRQEFKLLSFGTVWLNGEDIIQMYYFTPEEAKARWAEYVASEEYKTLHGASG